MALNEKDILYWLNKVYPILLENLTREYMEKKIKYDPDAPETRINFKGMDRNEAMEKALADLAPEREKYLNELDKIRRSYNKVSWFINKEAKKIPLPKPIKPTKVKVKKYDARPKSPDAYKRKLYIPKRFIRRARVGYLQPKFTIFSRIKEILDAGAIEGGEGGISCTFIYNNSPDSGGGYCEACKGLDGSNFDFNRLLTTGTRSTDFGETNPLGVWAISHYDCRCDVILKFKLNNISTDSGELEGAEVKIKVNYNRVDGNWGIINRYYNVVRGPVRQDVSGAGGASVQSGGEVNSGS